MGELYFVLLANLGDEIVGKWMKAKKLKINPEKMGMEGLTLEIGG